MRFKLKKDIVIKAGTIFSDAPVKTVRLGDHIDYSLGLTKNTSMHLTYAIDYSASKELERWFEVIGSYQKRRK